MGLNGLNEKLNFRSVEVEFPVEWNVSWRLLNQSRPNISDFKHCLKEQTSAKRNRVLRKPRGGACLLGKIKRGELRVTTLSNCEKTNWAFLYSSVWIIMYFFSFNLIIFLDILSEVFCTLRQLFWSPLLCMRLCHSFFFFRHESVPLLCPPNFFSLLKSFHTSVVGENRFCRKDAFTLKICWDWHDSLACVRNTELLPEAW